MRERIFSRHPRSQHVCLYFRTKYSVYKSIWQLTKYLCTLDFWCFLSNAVVVIVLYYSYTQAIKKCWTSKIIEWKFYSFTKRQRDNRMNMWVSDINETHFCDHNKITVNRNTDMEWYESKWDFVCVCVACHHIYFFSFASFAVCQYAISKSLFFAFALLWVNIYIYICMSIGEYKVYFIHDVQKA